MRNNLGFIVGLDILRRTVYVENSYPICGMVPALCRPGKGGVSTYTGTKVGLLSSGK